jgi:hypothetical protein
LGHVYRVVTYWSLASLWQYGQDGIETYFGIMACLTARVGAIVGSKDWQASWEPVDRTPRLHHSACMGALSLVRCCVREFVRNGD